MKVVADDYIPPPVTVCEKLRALLNLPKQVNFSSSQGKFKDDYDAVEYHGCILTVSGNIKTHPDYYNSLMQLYPTKGNELGKANWKADRQSDGPDGSSFTIMKGNDFCQVAGNWDEKLFVFKVACSVK